MEEKVLRKSYLMIKVFFIRKMKKISLKEEAFALINVNYSINGRFWAHFGPVPGDFS
jgi:hypothetical protein